MGKSTSDTFRDLLGGLTDDLKEAFDDIIDYDEHDRRRWSRRGRHGDGHWRRREDDDRWNDWDDGHWRQREDDGRWRDRGDDRRPREDAGHDSRGRSPRRAADLPRQSQRGRRTEQEDLQETVSALRSEMASFVDVLRETSAARGSAST